MHAFPGSDKAMTRATPLRRPQAASYGFTHKPVRRTLTSRQRHQQSFRCPNTRRGIG